MYENYPQSEKYIDGHAVHWYFNQYANPSVLDQSFTKYPNKLILATEACSGSKPVLGSWPRFEDYVFDIIENLNHLANAWIDWNMILDERGGPNYVNNFVDSPIVVNASSESRLSELNIN